MSELVLDIVLALVVVAVWGVAVFRAGQTVERNRAAKAIPVNNFFTPKFVPLLADTAFLNLMTGTHANITEVGVEAMLDHRHHYFMVTVREVDENLFREARAAQGTIEATDVVYGPRSE